MTTSARPMRLCALLAGSLLLSACGKHEDATPPAPAPATTVGTVPSPAAASSSAVAPATSAMAPAAPANAGSAALPAAASTTAATPAAPAAFAVDKVLVGDAVTAATHAVSHATDTIAADHRAIYASVETVGKTDGATLGARWRYLEGKGQLVSAISQSIATDGPAVTTFTIRNPDAWPAGRYEVQIVLDGKPVSTQRFDVKAPG